MQKLKDWFVSHLPPGDIDPADTRLAETLAAQRLRGQGNTPIADLRRARANFEELKRQRRDDAAANAHTLDSVRVDPAKSPKTSALKDRWAAEDHAIADGELELA